MAKKEKTNTWENVREDLGNLLTAIDSQFRESAVRAHMDVVQMITNLDPAQIDQIGLNPASLIPREVMGPKRIKFDFELTLRNNGVSLSRAYKLGCGVKGKVSYEWGAEAAPEATALIRTSAEADLNKRLKVVEWTEIKPSKPIDDLTPSEKVEPNQGDENE